MSESTTVDQSRHGLLKKEAAASPMASTGREENGVGVHQQPRGVYWRTPVLMALSLAAGIVFALVHHFFYRYWNGRAVDSDSQQQWIIRGGTYFAFGFKTSLAVATSIAYVQYLWLSLRRDAYQVDKINSMFSVLGNATAFLDLKLWLGLPLLAIPAIITWLMGLAAVITPGTLVVAPTKATQSLLQVVPEIDFAHPTYGSVQVPVENYGRADDELARIAIASAVTESILTITPPQPNSTYSIDFYSPALRCQVATDNDLRAVNAHYTNYTTFQVKESLVYFAWVPTSDHSTIDNPPDFGSPNFEALDRVSNRYYPNNPEAADQSAKLYFFVRGGYSTIETSLLNCSLTNASYTVNFNFVNNLQDLAIHRVDNLNGVSNYDGTDNTLGDIFGETFNKTIAYLSVMEAFGRIMTGKVSDTFSVIRGEVVSTMIQSTGLAPLLGNADNATLCKAIEGLFQNITFSLLGSPRFVLDPLNATLSHPIDTNVTYSQNIYVYRPLDVYLAYGIALLCSAACILIGCAALVRNGASYNNDFSTILRTTRSEDLTMLVREGESSGAEPTPDHTVKGLISYHPFASHGWAGFTSSTSLRLKPPHMNDQSL